MQIGEISQYGIFDSKMQFGSSKASALRDITEFEFDYILKCDESATSFVDNEKRRLQPQMLILRKPGQVSHSALHFTCYCLHIEVQTDSELYGELSSLPTYFTVIHSNVYKDIFEQIFQHLTAEGSTSNDYFIYAKILELIYFLHKDAEFNHDQKSTALASRANAVREATEYMEKNYNRKITLSVLSDIAGYSPNHFQKEFCRIMGVSPKKYLESVRLSAARLELCKREKSIAEIAYACGFCSQSHFSFAFKKECGMSPYDYRSALAVTYS